MRFHCLGLPHTVTNHEYVACAYTQKVWKFCKMMSNRGHHIIHYGHEDSNPICDEHVTVITNDVFDEVYGNHDWKSNWFTFDTEDKAYQTFYENTINEIWKRKQRYDFILPFWGKGVKAICDAHTDLITVEPGIGYGDVWADYKIFESYAMYHSYLTLEHSAECKQNWYEIVIPNYFDLEDFEYSEDKEDYFLFLGRVYEGKGIHIARQVCKAIGAKLIIAGQMGDEELPPWESNEEFVGYADMETRKKLMSKAKGAFIASTYVEPFGGVQIECLLSGTPTITTDWGAFTENNINGLTGYRCRTFNDFVWAAKNIDKIKSKDCRKFGEKFSLENIAPLYEKYFQDVLNTYQSKEGWYKTKSAHNDEIPANLKR